MSDPISRREFLHVTAATAVARASVVRAGAIGSLGFLPGGEQARPNQAATAAGAGWFDRPMRWVQLTLVENDPGRFDPGFWLDYFRRLHADAATLSAGGIVAYYPTEVPLHHRSDSLGTGDPFGELVTGCRKLNMNVLARVDPDRGELLTDPGAVGVDDLTEQQLGSDGEHVTPHVESVLAAWTGRASTGGSR